MLQPAFGNHYLFCGHCSTVKGSESKVYVSYIAVDRYVFHFFLSAKGEQLL